MKKEIKMGNLIKDKDIWEQDFGDFVIDREHIEKFSRIGRGSVRISQGLYYTKEEWETKRREILNKPLP